MPETVVPIKVYAVTLAALLALTAATCAISFIDLGRMNVVAAVVIAFVKASLVALIFMHLRYSRGIMRIVMASGLFLLAILIALTMGDYLTRGWQ
jgi:cytochrome c oxidase subunit 4